MKWNSIPGGEFIKQRFIPGIQARHQLLLAGKYNTMLGLSTGGRGVALIALENPGLFLAAASLSGDFSQENMPQDRLMTSIYGSFNSFAPRWQGRDNPQARVTEWSVPLYLAHGTADNIVPESQTAMFCQKLKAYHGHKILIQCDRIAGAGHDYKFWGGILPSVFQFFQQQKLIMNRAIR
jgi:S-formylglutathione hydrolase FrmB